MKENHISYRNIILIVCVSLLIGGLTATSQAKPSSGLDRSDASGRKTDEPARLIIHRLPNLGNNVIVDVSLDGAPFASVIYGQTFDGSLPAGHHVLSILATPRPTYVTPTTVALDVQSGKTYSFIAESNNSGNLILR